MRNTICLTLMLAATAFGRGPKQEPLTYLEGNLVGVNANSAGALVFTNDKQMELKTGLATVAVPYANISKAQLGAVREVSESAPVYKVWTLHKRILKPQMQKLQLDFKNIDGEQKSMTVELDKASANHVVDTIYSANNDVDTGVKTEQAATPNPNSWWGDSIWKTTRNQPAWPQPGQAEASPAKK